MLYAFTDESYVADNYLQGAFVVNEADLDQLDQVLIQTSEFAQRFGIAPGTELRGYSIMNSKDGWEPLREKFHARVAIYKFLFSRIREVGGSLHFVNENPSVINSKFSDQNSWHISTHHKMLDILNGLAVSSHREVSIVSDEITAQGILIEEFIKQSARLTNIKSLTFVESSSSSGVQIIDALLYIYQRTRQRNFSHHRSYKVTLELWELASNLVASIEPKKH